MRKAIFTVAAVILCLVTTARMGVAQTTQPHTLARVYDVRDLLMSLPDFSYHGTIGMPEENETVVIHPLEPAATQPTHKTRQELMDDIIRLVTDTVDPDSWKDNGGSVGAIRPFEGFVIVTQTEENQKLVTNLMAQLREEQTIVRVQADWVMLQPGQLRTLLGSDQGKGRAPATPRLVDAPELAKSNEPGSHCHR